MEGYKKTVRIELRAYSACHPGSRLQSDDRIAGDAQTFRRAPVVLALPDDWWPMLGRL